MWSFFNRIPVPTWNFNDHRFALTVRDALAAKA
jgi:hypothetical protein